MDKVAMAQWVCKVVDKTEHVWPLKRPPITSLELATNKLIL